MTSEQPKVQQSGVASINKATNSAQGLNSSITNNLAGVQIKNIKAQPSQQTSNNKFFQQQQIPCDKIRANISLQKQTNSNNFQSNYNSTQIKIQNLKVVSTPSQVINDDEDQTFIYKGDLITSQIDKSQANQQNQASICQIKKDTTPEDDDATVVNQVYTKLREDTFKEIDYTKLLQNQHLTLTYTEASSCVLDQSLFEENTCLLSGNNFQMVQNPIQNRSYNEETKIQVSTDQQINQLSSQLNNKNSNLLQSSSNQKLSTQNSTDQSNQQKQIIPSLQTTGQQKYNSSSNQEQYNQSHQNQQKQICNQQTGGQLELYNNQKLVIQQKKSQQNLTNPDSDTNQIQPIPGVYKFMSQEQQHQVLDGGLLLVKHKNKDVIINQKIFHHFGKPCIEKIAKNQTVIYGEQNEHRVDNKLETTQEIIDFLKLSRHFKHIENIEKLAEGGEAVVYKMNYLGYEEVVIKVPKIKQFSRMNTIEKGEAVLEGFEDLIHESQLIKSIYHEDYTVEVKEEIVEVDLKSNQLKKYLVIVERARYSLYDLYSFKAVDNQTVEKTGLWFKKNECTKNLENFSIYKFFYYFYHTAKAMEYFHSLGIIYSDLKPQNLLVMRNQKIKIGDFGVSILMKNGVDSYQIKGLSPAWCIPEISEKFHRHQMKRDFRKFYAMKWHKKTLMLNDVFALSLTFSNQLIQFLLQNQTLSSEDSVVADFFGQISVEMALKRSISLSEAIEKMDKLLKDSFIFYYTLIQILRQEKKYEAAYNIGLALEKQVQSLKFSEHQKLFIYLSIQKMMAQFMIFQGNYQQAIKHIQELDKKIRENDIVIKASHKKEFVQLKFNNHIQLAKIMIYMGNVFEGEKQAEIAYQMYDLQSQTLIGFHFEVLELKGLILMSKGMLKEALPIFIDYSKQIESVFNQEDNQVTVYSYIKVGEVFYRLQNYEESLKFYEKAENIIFAEYGSYHPMILDCYKVKGSIYLKMNQLEKATIIFNKALEMSLNIFGEKNIQTAETYRQIGDLCNKKQLQKAIYYYEKAKQIYDFLYNDDNIHSVIIYNNMAGLYESIGNFKLAEEMCLKSLKIKAALHQEDNVDIAIIYSNLCQLKIAQQDIPSAENFSKLAFEIKSKMLGIQHQDSIFALINYLKLLTQSQKIKKALALGQESLHQIKDHYEEDSPVKIHLTQLIGQLLVKDQKLQEAEGIFKQLNELIQNSLKPDLKDLFSYKCLRDLGIVFELKDDERVILIYEECLEILKTQLEIESQLTSSSPTPTESNKSKEIMKMSRSEKLAEMFGLHKSLGGIMLRRQNLQGGLQYLNKALEMLAKYQDSDRIVQKMNEQFYDIILDMKTKCEEHLRLTNQSQN